MPVEAPALIDPNDLKFEPAAGRAVYRNVPIPLTQQQLEILQFIYSRHPRHISKSDLFPEFWKDKDEEPNLVHKAVSLLNESLSGFGLFVLCTRNVGYRIVQGERSSSRPRRHGEYSKRFAGKVSIQAFNDWREAYPIISRMQQSLVIIDSYFGHSGEIEPLINDALSNPSNRLNISIYLASPSKDFGAQRFKEKERPRGLGLKYKQLLIGNDRKRDRELLKQYRKKYREAYESDVNEIKGHFIKPRIRLRIYTYPIMPATRVYVVDDTQYIFGRFPLLGHNPGHPCFWATLDDNLSGAAGVAINALAQQVKIIRNVSSRVWPPIRNKGEHRTRQTRPTRKKRAQGNG